MSMSNAQYCIVKDSSADLGVNFKIKVDFIPIFVFRFGRQIYENTKILRNLLFICQGKMGKTEI